MRIPRISEGFELTQLHLDPFEGFILSRIDGRTSVDDIADLTGASVEQVEGALAKIDAAGGLEWMEEPRIRSTPPEKPRRAMPTPGKGTVRTRPAPPGASRLLYDPAELEEADVDLDVDRRRTILDAYYRLEELDHYALLGVERDADKAAIRAAYFTLSKQFHPDTLYGKRLGTYKSKMEAVFQRLTEAYEILGKKKKRRQYDDYLQTRDSLEKVRRGLDAGATVAKEVERTARAAAEQAVVMPSGAKKSSSTPPPAAARTPLRAPPNPRREKRAGEPSEKGPPESAPEKSSATSEPSAPEKTSAPEKSSSAPPQKSSSAPPQKSSSAPPEKSSSTPPQKSSSAPPEKSSSAPPEKSSSAPPQKSSSAPPEKSSSAPPQKTSSTPPRTEPLVPPKPPADARATRADRRPRTVEEERAVRRRSRDLLLKRLQGATGRGRASVRPPSAPPQDTAETKVASRESLLRGLATSLKGAARHTGGVDRVEKHLNDSKEAEASGDLVGAVNALRLGLALAPDREDLQQEHKRLRGALAKELSATYEKQARYEEDNGLWAAASRSWVKVSDGRPTDGRPLRRAAAAMLKAKNADLKEAKQLAQKSVDLEPRSARARLILAQVFLAAGMQANAQRELEAAAKLDPRDEVVKTLLRELK